MKGIVYHAATPREEKKEKKSRRILHLILKELTKTAFLVKPDFKNNYEKVEGE